MRISSSSPIRSICGLATLLLFLALTAGDTVAKPSFVVRPEPAWIKPAEVDQKSSGSGRPSSILLEDQETRLSPQNLERFHRHVERVDTSGGLDRVSQLRFYFEPSYQTLAIHFIRITRGEQTTSALKPSEIKVIQKEDELDEQIYNGTLAAVIFLNDVRVGDIIDYAYTVSGDNPVFGGRFADRFYLADSEPIQTLRVRVIAPSDRVLHQRNLGPEFPAKINSLGSDTEYLWEKTGVPAVDFEDSTPSWYEPIPSVWVSEFSDWQTVVQWALPLYQINEPLAAELRTRSDAWAKQFPSLEQRMIAALRLIQQEVRYLGIELGSYSHRPNPASRTLARRFGDCKDKSLLLLTVLKHMGIDCAIALVNTRAKHAIETWQPSPHAFDHAIVQARIGGKTYWLDSTIESQRGNLDQYYDLPYERALVLRSDTLGLETIPGSRVDSAETVIHEHYTPSGNTAFSLVVTSTYRGAAADGARYRWSQNSPAEMGRRFLNYYAETNPSIRADGVPQIQDNEASNTLIVTERYVIDSFWKDQSHYLTGDVAYAGLPRPDISQRSMPLAIPHPTHTTQIVEVDLPSTYDLTPHSEVITDDAFRFEYKYDSSGGKLRLTYSVQTLRDYVPPEKVTSYLAKVNRIWNSTGLQLPRSALVIVRTSNHATERNLISILAIILVVLLIALPVVVSKVRRMREQADRTFSSKPSPGTAPDTAVRSEHINDIETFARSFKCKCGSNPYRPEDLLHQETLLFDGERLVTFKLKCQTCGRARDLYFVKPSPLEPDKNSVVSH